MKIKDYTEYYLFWNGSEICKELRGQGNEFFMDHNLFCILSNYQITRLEHFIGSKPITTKAEAEKIIKEFREINNI